MTGTPTPYPLPKGGGIKAGVLPHPCPDLGAIASLAPKHQYLLTGNKKHPIGCFFLHNRKAPFAPINPPKARRRRAGGGCGSTLPYYPLPLGRGKGVGRLQGTALFYTIDSYKVVSHPSAPADNPRWYRSIVPAVPPFLHSGK